MKATLIFLFLSFCAVACSGQWAYNYLGDDANMLFTSGDYMVGKDNGGGLGLSFVHRNKYIIKIGYAATNKSTPGLPDEILKSSQELTLTNKIEPFENMENLYVMAGRVVRFKPNSRFRLILQGGPGISTFRSPKYSINGSSYNYKINTEKELALVLNPKMEMPLGSTLGVSAGPMIVVNKSQTYVGAGIGIMYGILANM